jgi:broad specificity phosphatase PhoE
MGAFTDLSPHLWNTPAAPRRGPSLQIYLVRHARAEARKDWTGDDLLRPLNAAGHEQARALADHLAAAPLTRIVSGPSLRCQQSVEPLAMARGMAVEVDERLAAGETVQRALELLPAYGEGPVLFCTHADLIAALLRLFELTDLERDGVIPCKKGSIWVLEGPGYAPASASYREPVLGRPRPKSVPVFGFAPAEPRSVRAATLDLGSTSFNLLIADVTRRGILRPVVQEKVMLRLGAVIASNALIPDAVCERAVEVARELRVVAEQEKVQRLFPVATSALRDAENGAALADRIGRALGTPVRVLRGEEEARLMFEAFRRRVPLGRKPALGLDLGGGSLELAVGSRDALELEATLPLGVARLHGELGPRDPLRKRDARAIRDRVREHLAPWREAIRSRELARVVATGGSVRALARLLDERARSPRRSGPYELEADTLRRLAKELAASTLEERLLMRGIRKRRADLLPTAALILEALVDELAIEEITVSDWGLREGVMLEALASPS